MPMTCHRFDMTDCWMTWANATGGWRPWEAYRLDGYIYPPVVLYLLTAIRRVEIWTGLPIDSGMGVAAIKLPSVIAYAAGGWVCAYGLSPSVDRRAAARAASAWVLCLPLWYNAAVWGQWDALLSLVLLIALIAALRGREVISGVAIGVGLCLKLQAIVLLPALVIYGFRRYGTAAVARAAGAVVAGWIIVTAPMLLGGLTAVHGLQRAYFSSVDFFPRQTVVACNIWMIGETATTPVRHWPTVFGATDDEVILGAVTAKHLGLLLFGGYSILVLTRLWLFPDPRRFVLSAGLVAFAFFMLLTQMHERYVIPACGLLAVAAAWPGGWKYFWIVTIPAMANQIVGLIYENAVIGRASVSVAEIAAYQPWFLIISIVNVLAMTLVTFWFLRDRSPPEQLGRLISNRVDSHTTGS